ncbi:TonB-dependent siderophore receptor [Herminiimonas arsenitoxidans]|uniref:TonB-dependent siderophore receptor n=1 Tax=Herminiimonas arsenitoxidans TaxID=1809410 RepID=UPI00097041A0|nr:TonB-dependent receptor [Herminiimonas arsenitoxidans]
MQHQFGPSQQTLPCVRTLTPASNAVRLAVLSMALAAPIMLAGMSVSAHAQSASSQQSYQIAPGPLGAALAEFAAASGITLSTDSAQTRELTSAGLTGKYSVDEGFTRLLEGSGLEAIRQTNGGYILRKVAPGTTTLPAVSVNAKVLDPTTEGTGSYTTNTVTIGKWEQSLRQIPQSVSVLTKQRMLDQNMTQLEEALDQVTGVQLDTTTGASGAANLVARGFPITSYQYDGVPQTFLGTSYTGYDVAVLDRIEVIRGAAGLLQGAGNPSATVNLVRKKPTHEFAGSVAASMGAWDSYRSEFDIGGPLNASGSVRGRFVGVYDDRGSYVDYQRSKKSIFYGVVDIDLAPATMLTLGLQQQQVNAVPSIFGLPRYSDGRSLGLPRSTNLTPAWNRWDQDITEVFAGLTHRIDNDWKLNFAFNGSHQQQDFKRSVTSGTAANGGVVPGSSNASIYTGIKWHSDGDRYNLDANADGKVTLFGRRHDVLIGVNAQSYNVDTKGSNFLPPVAIPDIFNFDPSSVPEPDAGPYTSGTTATTKQYGVYGSTRLNLSDPLKLILGARLSWYKTQTDNHNFVTGVTTQGRQIAYNSELTPYAGLVYELNDRYSLYASYADIFLPQTTQFTVGGKELAPIVGSNYEIGLKGEFFNGALNASIAAFRIDQKNRAQETVGTPCAGAAVTGWCYEAQGKVRSEGIETEVSGKLTPDWDLFAGYTYNSTKYMKDLLNEGTSFRTQTPRHLFKLWTQYRLPIDERRWSVGGGINAQSSYYALNGTVKSEQGAFSVLKMSIVYRYSDKITASLVINNVLDKVYYSGIRGVNFGNVYGDPRNATLTLRASF